MKRIISILLISAIIFASEPVPADDTNSTAPVVTEQSSGHGPLFKAALIVGVPIVMIGGVVYYAVLTPIALVYWVFGIEPFQRKAEPSPNQ